MNIIKQNEDNIHMREEELTNVRSKLQDILFIFIVYLFW